MMMAVMCGPPHGAPLDAACAPDGHDELKRASGLEGSVREVTVVETGDGEHAREIQENTDAQRGPAPTHTGDKGCQTRRVHQEKRHAAEELDLLFFRCTF